MKKKQFKIILIALTPLFGLILFICSNLDPITATEAKKIADGRFERLANVYGYEANAFIGPIIRKKSNIEDKGYFYDFEWKNKTENWSIVVMVDESGIVNANKIEGEIQSTKEAK